MKFILFQRGATSWGFQIGRVYMYVPYLKYIIKGCWPTINIEPRE